MDVWTFWLFNGKMVEAKPFHTGNKQDLSYTVTNISTLVLKNIMLSQTGVYTCGANSTGVIKTQNITVTVKDLEGPTLVQTKSKIDAVDGENITLSCNAVYPEAFFVDTFWIFNGSRINSNDKYKEKNTSPWLEQSERSVKRMEIGLTVYNVGLNDSGGYICALNTSVSLQLKNVSVKVRRRLGKHLIFPKVFLKGTNHLGATISNSVFTSNNQRLGTSAGDNDRRSKRSQTLLLIGIPSGSLCGGESS